MLFDLLLRHAFVVLGGDDDAGGANRLAVDIAQRDLALRVRLQTQDGQIAGSAQFTDPAQDEMRIVERRGHQLLGLAAGVAEHDALIAGAFVLVAGGVDAHRDVGGLGMEMHVDLGVAPGEAGLVVADVMHGESRQMSEVFRGDGIRAAGLAREHDAVGGHQRLAGDARIGVCRQEGVEHRVADPVGDLVGVAFGDRFRREEVLAGVAH